MKAVIEMKIELKINGTDVSRDLEKFPHALTYEDAQSGETDSLTLELMDRARLFISGGGSLLQDVTSRRSLW